MKKISITLNLFCLVVFCASMTSAAEPAEQHQQMTYKEFVSSLSFQNGHIELPGGVATLELTEMFTYLHPEDAARVIVQAWGNPAGDGTLGMIFPKQGRQAPDLDWGVVITYEEDGHVSDEDAGNIDYEELLQKMKKRTAESSKDRQAKGYSSIELIGWAAAPRYDQANHKLYWAKELASAEHQDHTLNYNIRILGRKGVLVLNAVSAMDLFPKVEEDMRDVLTFTNFTEGNLYSDFDAKTDKKAAYGLAALVAGGVAAKAGLFTKLLGVLLVAKKFIVVGLIAAGAFLKKMFTRNK